MKIKILFCIFSLLIIETTLTKGTANTSNNGLPIITQTVWANFNDQNLQQIFNTMQTSTPVIDLSNTSLDLNLLSTGNPYNDHATSLNRTLLDYASSAPYNTQSWLNAIISGGGLDSLTLAIVTNNIPLLQTIISDKNRANSTIFVTEPLTHSIINACSIKLMFKSKTLKSACQQLLDLGDGYNFHGQEQDNSILSFTSKSIQPIFCTPLHLAAAFDRSENSSIITSLISYVQPTTSIDDYLMKKNGWGDTALIIAARYGNSNAITTLLNRISAENLAHFVEIKGYYGTAAETAKKYNHPLFSNTTVQAFYNIMNTAANPNRTKLSIPSMQHINDLSLEGKTLLQYASNTKYFALTWKNILKDNGAK